MSSLIKSFEAKALKKRAMVVKLADSLTKLFGGITFFIINMILFAFWVAVNTNQFPQIKAFDPFPFPLLTTMVSLEAIALSIIVLMSAQRQSYISTLREELDMQVNLISERQTTKILKLLKIILEKDDKKFSDSELNEMIKDTDVSYIERRLQAQIEGAVSKKSNVVEIIKKPIIEVEKIASHVTHLTNGVK